MFRFVRTLRGATIAMDVDLQSDKVMDLKEKLYAIEGMQPTTQLLTYCGKPLVSSRPLSDYKIADFCTIDLSLRILSSSADPLTIHLSPKSSTNNQIELPFDPSQTLDEIAANLRSSENEYQCPQFHCFLHCENRYPSDSNIALRDIPGMWGNRTLKIRPIVPFREAKQIKIMINYPSSDPITIPIKIPSTGRGNLNKSKIPLMSRRIDGLIREAFRDQLQTDSKVAPFLHPECPFESINVIHHGTDVALKLRTPSKVAMSMYKDTTNDSKFMIAPRITLGDLERFFPECDCERKRNAVGPRYNPDDWKIVERNNKYSQVPLNQMGRIIGIQVTLCTESFLFGNDYYLNGQFYPRFGGSNIGTLDSLLFPIMPSPQKENERLLVHGFIKRINENVDMEDDQWDDTGNLEYYDSMIPHDITKVIHSYFPQLYGGRYNVKDHNPKLHEQFEQKTNVFTIQDLDICLFYGNEVFSDHYGMTINFEHSKAVLVTLRITARCTVSQQCNTIIQTVDATENQGGTVHLKFGSFGLQTSLSTMVCEVQIIRMLTDTLYEYPLRMTQSAFLMEWTISSELLDRFKQCIQNDEHGMTFESRVFYDMLSASVYRLFLYRIFVVMINNNLQQVQITMSSE